MCLSHQEHHQKGTYFMTHDELSRRTFLRRTGQAGGLVAAGGMLEYILAACGGNVSTTTGSSATPGATKVVQCRFKDSYRIALGIRLCQWCTLCVPGSQKS